MNDEVVDNKETVLVMDRETLHAIARKAGAAVGKALYVEPGKLADAAEKLANATAVSGSTVTIRIVD